MSWKITIADYIYIAIYLIEEVYAKILIHVLNCLYYWLGAG